MTYLYFRKGETIHNGENADLSDSTQEAEPGFSKLTVFSKQHHI